MPLMQHIACDRITVRDRQRHDLLAGLIVKLWRQKGLLDVVPVAPPSVATTHHDVVRMAHHLMTDARRHNNHIAHLQPHFCPALYGQLELHPARGAA